MYWGSGRVQCCLSRVATGLCFVQADRSIAPAPGQRHSGLVMAAAITAVVLCLTFTAQAQTKTPSVAKKPAASAPNSKQDPQLYRNTTFGFRFQIPYSWVDRTEEMQDGDKPGKAELLLAVFERPPETTGDSVNSAVVIASESAASYSGLKKAEDYLGPLTELATSKGFKAEGEPYTLEVESRQLLRADFVKTLNDKLTMLQCTLVMLTKNQIVSFTFIASSDDALDELMDGLHFSAPH
jgi:hypothetical protein